MSAGSEFFGIGGPGIDRERASRTIEIHVRNLRALSAEGE
jgi:hypothetical protein